MSDLLSLPRAGEYAAVLADPPWAFKTYGGKHIAPARGAQPYGTMSLDGIKGVPLSTVTARDCLLFLWTVSHLQPEALEVAAAWDFRHVSIAFVWDKGRMGMGYWTRQEVEICHLFKRGKPKRISKGVRQLIVAPRREHSRKPDEQYERIEALVGGPYLELFARQSGRPGWDCWGNETTKFNTQPTALATLQRLGQEIEA